ncbi:MAG: class I SAM-dependent methyltransferase [Bryobacteraceae bacterium]
MSDWNYSLTLPRRADESPRTISDRTRRVYDRLAAIYPASTFFFHSKAHRKALEVSGIESGMKVLELATGSGEMFRRLVRANPKGQTFGLDLSPNMAARTQRRARAEFKDAQAHCQAVDARYLPFKDASFDAVMCCFLLELLDADGIRRSLAEVRRVLKPGAKFTLVVIGQNAEIFNQMYRVCGKVAPAFWGRQVDASIPETLHSAQFAILEDHVVRQGFYPSRVFVTEHA